MCVEEAQDDNWRIRGTDGVKYKSQIIIEILQDYNQKCVCVCVQF